MPEARAAAATAPSADRTLLDSDSNRTTISQPRIISSLRSSSHCRLSHGSASRSRIFAKPSPTGSIESVAECSTRLRTSS
jgi:hypothetical protein